MTCPSTRPELQGVESPAVTALMSRLSGMIREYRGLVIGEDALHPGGQLIAPQVTHHGGEVADLVGDGVEFATAGPDLLEV